jgi:hypothetical protein
MRAFLVACLAIVVIGAGGYFLLNAIQEPSGVAYTTDGARISTNWSWREPTTKTAQTAECDARKSWQWIFVDFGNPKGESAVCSVSQ